jgi:hypothetical protein
MPREHEIFVYNNNTQVGRKLKQIMVTLTFKIKLLRMTDHNISVTRIKNNITIIKACKL